VPPHVHLHPSSTHGMHAHNGLILIDNKVLTCIFHDH
jgi:hypothetical protein